MVTEAEIMDISHRSWARKEELVQQVRFAVAALADNVYTEYSTFRMCGRKAAYDEAIEYVNLVTNGAVQNCRDQLGAKVYGD